MEEHENQQLYCETDKRFLADRYVEGICPKCNYDVSLSELRRRLEESLTFASFDRLGRSWRSM